MRRFFGLIACLLLAGALPASAAITLHSHALSVNGNTPSVTIDTTGDSLIAVCVVGDGGNGSTKTVSDNRNGSYTRVASPLSIAGTQTELWWVNVTVPNASTTITYSGNFSNIGAMSFAGTATSSPTDGAATGATQAFASSIQPGSITPSQANGMLFSCFGGNPGVTTITVSSPFTIPSGDSIPGDAAAQAYSIQTSAAAANPTWSGTGWSGSEAALASMQAFKDPGGGGGGTPFHGMSMMGVGH